MAIKTTGPNVLAAWIPEKDPHVLAAVGKMGEEASELSKACFRAVIAGLNAPDHDNPEQTNLDKLIEEYSDVLSTFKVLRSVVNIDQQYEKDIPLRINAKEAHGLRWQQLIRAELAKP